MGYALGFPKPVTDIIYALREWPPRRPQRTSSDRAGRDAFLMDFENDVLREYRHSIPTGPRRYEKAEWAGLIKILTGRNIANG